MATFNEIHAANGKHDRGFVYFASTGDGALVKIGFTHDLSARLAQMRTACPFELDYLEVFPGTKDDEKRLQKSLVKYRTNREWFTASDEVMDVIDDILDYQLDVACSTSLADKKWPNSDDAMTAVSAIPICGFWIWKSCLDKIEGSHASS